MLVTGDKDAYQLVGDNVKIYANKKGISEYEIYGEKEVRRCWACRPEQVIDYMALTGDTSDNVPGVKGIGEKTALKLIAGTAAWTGSTGTSTNVTGKQKETLVREKEMAYLSRDLVTVRTDLPIDLDLGSGLSAASVFATPRERLFQEDGDELDREGFFRRRRGDEGRREVRVKEEQGYRHRAHERGSLQDMIGADTEARGVSPLTRRPPPSPGRGRARGDVLFHQGAGRVVRAAPGAGAFSARSILDPSMALCELMKPLLRTRR